MPKLMLNREEHSLKANRTLPFEKREVVFIILLFFLILSVYSLNLTKSVITPDGAGYPLVAELLLPGWMDGKPAYIWTGRLVYEFWHILTKSREALIKAFAFYSALFGAMTAVNIYLVFRNLFNRRYLGGMASMLSAFAPMFFYSAVTIEVYMFNIFWATLAVLFWLKRKFVLWGIAWGLALSSHITSIFLLIPFSWSLIFSNHRNQWKKFLLGSCFALFICIISYSWVLSFYTSLPAFIKFYRSISQDEYLHWPTLAWVVQNLTRFKAVLGVYMLISGGLLFYFRKQWRKILLVLILLPFFLLYLGFYKSNLFLLWKSCGYILTSLGLVAAFLLYRKKYKSQQMNFLLSWVLPYAIFFLGWIQDGGQFYLYLVPPISLIMVGLFDNIIEKSCLSIVHHLSPSLLRAKGNLVIVVFLFIFTLFGGLFQKIGTIRWLHNNLSYTDQYALQIRDQIPSESVLIASWMDPIVKFYSPDIQLLGFPFIGAPLDLVLSHFNSNLQKSINSGKKVFVTKGFLFQGKDSKTVLARETIQREFALLKVNDDIYRIVGKKQKK